MSEIENPTRAVIYEAIINILDHITILHKRIDDLHKEITMIRAGEGEK